MSFSVRRVTAPKKRPFPWKKIATLLTLLRPLAGWYRAWKQQREEEREERRRQRLLKRGLLILLAVLCAFFLVAGTVRALVTLKVITMRSLIQMTGTPPPADGNGFTNVLLLGQGDKDHDGTDLTDTIIVASIDPRKTKSAVLLSLPRDLFFLRTEKMGKGRLNSLYRDYKILLKRQGMGDAEASRASMEQLAREIGDVLALPIHAVIKADFTGFEKAVDVIGGIDVTVPEAIDDAEYPDENYGFEPFSLAAGPAHLDGKTALKYVRSRHTSSDFDRSARQQQVIKAIGEKVKEKGLSKNVETVSDLFKIFEDHVLMTLSIRELIGLADAAEGITPDRVLAFQLNDRNALYDGAIEPGGFLYTPPRDQFEGASVLLPVSIPEFPVTWKQVQAFSNLIFRNRALLLDRVSVAVLNAGAGSGLARKLGNELIRYGFTVERIENSVVTKKDLKEKFNSYWSMAHARSGAAPGRMADFLGKLLVLQAVTEPGGAIDPAQMADVTIVITEDFTYKPLQDLLPNAL